MTSLKRWDHRANHSIEERGSGLFASWMLNLSHGNAGAGLQAVGAIDMVSAVQSVVPDGKTC